ncbi:unnamed protein product [Brachionus calyciflorus]|uniref:Uncharacterized protein n=1 Tax=Brachionus calyciflorus TaxID=104777 RepID=A0A813XB43_9BILA|nr:unnamed protein product [Brachionus calyciflorus]
MHTRIICEKENPDYYEICLELEDLLDDIDDIPKDYDQFYQIYQKTTIRKQLKDVSVNQGTSFMIEMVMSTIPKLSYEQLKKESKKQDSNALLSLGDCFLFGLKGVRKNKTKAANYYLESANLNNPEAMTMLAYLNYLRLIEITNLRDDDPIPIYRGTPPQAFKYHRDQMWQWLEKCVELQWITPFLIKHAKDARKYRPDELSPIIKRELIKREVEVFKILQEKDKKFTLKCENLKCPLKFENNTKIFQCSKCKKIKYCSRDCQIAHWSLHKKDCKASNNEQRDISDNPRQEGASLITVKLPHNEIVEFESKTIDLKMLHRMHFDQEDEKQSLILSRARMTSNRNLMSKKELDELINQLILRHSYTSAIKYITLAIDKMHLEKYFSKMNRRDQVELMELFLKRVQCYLEIANSRIASRYNKMALDDCDFVLETGIFEKIDCDAYLKLKEIKLKLETVAPAPNQEITRNRPDRTRQKKSNFDISKFGKIKITTCYLLIENKMALNSQIDLDYCTLCSTEWSKFLDPSIAVILPCEHAFCASCLCKYKKACKQVKKQEEVPHDSACSLCRQEFSPMYIEEMCKALIKERKNICVFEQLDKLPLDKEESEKLLCTLLIDNYFDVNKIESILFNMIGMIQADTGEDLDYTKKQEYFEIARAPVLKLHEEYLKLEKQLENILDMNSFEWNLKYKKLEELREKLKIARSNAANDIYERMNAPSTMGNVINDKLSIQVDLHGLFVKEAIGKVEEFVLPLLDVLKEIMLITGRGSHNKTGQANLKNGLKQYFNSKNIKYKDVERNEGAIFIFQN